MDALQEYLDYCDSIKSLNRKRKRRIHGEAPIAGHHKIPTSQGAYGGSDWEHENVIPMTPSENYKAHLLQMKAYPDDPIVQKKAIEMTAGGILDTPEKFERYVTRLYDKAKMYDSVL